MRISLILIGLLGLFSVSCAHTHRVQVEEGTSQPSAVQVGIGSEEVKEGDRLDVIDYECKPVTMFRKKKRMCKDVKVGQATITKVLGPQLALATPEPGLKLTKKMRVEKKEVLAQ